MSRFDLISYSRSIQDPIAGNLQEQEERKTNTNEKLSNEVFWEKGELIGTGSYGNVYQGLNLINGRLIAIKHIEFKNKRNLEDLIKQQNWLQSEIEIMRRLDHPNIVKYIDSYYDEDRTQADILMEYVPGGSLSGLLKKFGPFNQKITKIYLLQILSALDHMHNKKIMHRDLKWANILISNEASIKISDFGASKKLKKSRNERGYELTKSLKGSPYWIAPEVANGEGHGLKVDIWSLGWLSIEMLTGQPPWSDKTKKAK